MHGHFLSIQRNFCWTKPLQTSSSIIVTLATTEEYKNSLQLLMLIVKSLANQNAKYKLH